MKQFKIELDEQVSIWQRSVMWVEAKDEEHLRKQFQSGGFDIIDVCSVDDFPETIEHISYDDRYFEILEVEDQYEKEAV
jgi:hypothetical protein